MTPKDEILIVVEEAAEGGYIAHAIEADINAISKIYFFPELYAFIPCERKS
jgi:hypothetical protein